MRNRVGVLLALMVLIAGLGWLSLATTDDQPLPCLEGGYGWTWHCRPLPDLDYPQINQDE